MSQRVVITGIGVVSAIGMDKESFWTSVSNGKSGVVPISKFDVSPFRTKIAAEIQDFRAEDYLNEKEISRMDRFSHFSIAAAQKALEDAHLELNGIPRDIGVIIGTSVGGIFTHEMTSCDFFTKGASHVHPLAIPLIMYNSGASNIAQRFKFTGPNYTVTTACASGSNAVGESFRSIKHGYAEMIVTGGADATLSPVFFSAWNKLRALSRKNDEPQRACKPFSKNRDGFVIGEGAGILILESLEHAQKRSAHIYGEMVGYGNTSDAHHLTFPNVDEEVKAMRIALDEAGISPEAVSYVNAHGTGTYANDKVETQALKAVLGKQAYDIPVSSTKPMMGHTLGASGAMELIVCLLAMHHGFVPPTINHEVSDPECDLDVVPNHGRDAEINIAMSNSFGFGGTNAVLIIKKWEEE